MLLRTNLRVAVATATIALVLASAQLKPGVWGVKPNPDSLSGGLLPVSLGVDSLKDLTFGETDGLVAWGQYEDKIAQEGWGQMNIVTDENYLQNEQLYAAGFLEGFLTGKRIIQFYHQFYKLNFPNTTASSELKDFIQNQMDWLYNQTSTNEKSLYWRTTFGVLNQLEGLQAGVQHLYKSGEITESLSLFELYLLSSDGDLGTVIPLFPSHPQHRHMSSFDPLEFELQFGSCSALIKVIRDETSVQDVFFGHATWSKFGWMMRIFKHFNFGFGRTISYTSRPGFLTSKDDYFLIDGTLAVMETTNEYLNKELSKELKPQTSPTWVRAVVANLISWSGKTWTQNFAKYNSGTYNNQWMVLDYSKVGKRMKPGALWILEQIPSFTQSKDVTDVLVNQGYWASYNVPYFKEISERSGFLQMAQNDTEFSYDQCPRANIFRRDAPLVSDFESFGRLMRQNKWKTDEFSLGNPKNAIAARYDLLDEMETPLRPRAYGAIDAKLTSVERIKSHESRIVCGPTHDDQKVFTWDKFPDVPHEGLPDSFDFDWISTKPLIPFDILEIESE